MSSILSRLSHGGHRRRDGSLRPTLARDVVGAIRRITYELEELGVINHLSRTDTETLEAVLKLLIGLRKRHR